MRNCNKSKKITALKYYNEVNKGNIKSDNKFNSFIQQNENKFWVAANN